MVRILQLANKLPYPPKDGGAIGILNFTKGFYANKAVVSMLAMNTAKHYFNKDKLPPEIRKLAHFYTVDINARPEVWGALSNFIFSSLPYTASRFICKAFEKKLISLLKKDKFDIVQLEGIYLAPYIPIIRQYSDSIISLRAHNIEHEIWKRIAANAPFPKNIYFKNLTQRVKKFEKKYINEVDVILPISERDHQQLIDMGLKIPHHLIPAGINLEEYEMKRNEIQFPGIFHLGALDWEPNIEGLQWFLKKVWPIVLKEYPETELHIAGRGATASIQQMLSQQKVVFDGEVEDAHAYMHSKGIMIVPLLSGGGMRIKILEGMALGKTIVSTDIGAEGIHGEHQENIIIANDPESFARELIELISNPEKFNSIGEKARIFIRENYDNFALVKSLLNYYKQIK